MIDKSVLDELRRLSKDIKTDALFEQRDEDGLAVALNLNRNTHIKFIERLLSCVKVQLLERADMERNMREQRGEINALRGQIEGLKAENQRMRKEMDAYNGVLRQRARVKAGTVKPAENQEISRERIEGLQARGHSISEIADMLGCSRSTIWRRLKD